ncbi:hypothetical protein CBF27_04320 [Vagococcus acidifermentans]|uniref:Uncharacterized protein n=1 Tax=Vagococcus acidifermentans TaxID=564710 RepID=A0A430AZC1_9ENTE|nr:hypothetical protein CBF27_04320 [Vagococcus acidifermentans]
MRISPFIFATIFSSLALFTLISFFQLISSLFKVTFKKYDELERKLVFDSLGVSMLILLLIHLLQLLFALIGHKFSFMYMSGIKITLRFLVIPMDNFVLESLILDVFLIGLTSLVLRYKYGLISSRQLTKKYVILTIFAAIAGLILVYLYF